MDIMLFHSVLGPGPAVEEAAERLREAGHYVHVPDLFDGQTAASVEEGMEIKDRIGKETLLRRAVLAAAPLSDQGLVYAGFSLGASVAQTLALGDRRARALLLMHGTSDIAPNAAVEDLPVQLHVADPDPFETHDWLTAWYLGMQRAGADVGVFRYPGAGHLFTHRGLPDHDEAAAGQAWRQALAFLGELASSPAPTQASPASTQA